jgi:DNA invertase Pin-like site-specific DNA recombinase
MRVALYARVSTLDKDQNPQNQLEPLRAWCSNKGHTITAEYVEHKSGRKSADQRPELARLLEDAHKAKFDLVQVWALDRLSREGTYETITYLKRLHACGVSVHSYSEPALSTDNEMVRDIVLTVMASLAKAEAERISARTKAGMERARKEGAKFGRPSALDADPSLRARVEDALRAGKGVNSVAKLHGLGNSTVQSIKAEMAA